MRLLESVWLGFFLVGLVLTAVLGNWATSAPFWYGGAFLSVAGIGALGTRHRRRRVPVDWWALAVLAVCAGWILGRALTSPVWAMARQDLIFGGAGLLCWVLTAFVFCRRGARGALFCALSVLILANVAVGAYQVFGRPSFHVLGFLGIHRGGERGAGGFFESAHHLCGFLELAGLPALGVAVAGRIPPVLRIVSGGVFLCAAVGVILSGSRIGLLAFAAGVFVLFLLAVLRRWRESERQRKPLLVCVVLSGLIGLLLIGWLDAARSPQGNLWSLPVGRSAMWKFAIEQWQQSPVIGTGGRSYEYMERLFRSVDQDWIPGEGGDKDAIFAHSDVLQCLGDYGLIGLVLALGVLVTHLRSGWRYLRGLGEPDNGFQAGMCLGALAGLIALTIHSFSDFNLHIGANVVLTGVILGILARPDAGGRPAANTRRLSVSSLIATTVAAAIGVILIVSGTRLAPADYYSIMGQRSVIRAGTLDDRTETLTALIAAMGDLEKSSTLDPKNPTTQFYWGLANHMMGVYMPMAANSFSQKALDHFRKSLALYPQDPYCWAYAGLMLDYQGRFEEAETCYTRARRWGDGVKLVHRFYGDHLLLQKRYFEALGVYLRIYGKVGGVDREELNGKISFCRERIQEETRPAAARGLPR